MIRSYNYACLASEFTGVKRSLESKGYYVFEPYINRRIEIYRGVVTHWDTANFTYVRSDDLNKLAQRVLAKEGGND